MKTNIPSNKSGIPILKLSSGQTFDLDRDIRIGRATDNDVVLKDPTVSRHHCSIVNRGGIPELQDTGSSGGTWLNGEKIAGQPRVLTDGDTIRVGSSELQVGWREIAQPVQVLPPVADPVSASTQVVELGDVPVVPVATPSTRAGVPLYIRRGVNAPQIVRWNRSAPFVIGRADDSPLIVADDTVSRHHAKIETKDGVSMVTDLGSANRTLLNGHPVLAPHELSSGDVLKAGPLELVYDPLSMQSREAVLVVRGGGQDGKERKLARDTAVIGSASNCDLVLRDAGVAPRHVEIRRFASDFWLFPLGDAQTSVGLNAISGPRLLENGDTIQLGSVGLIFRQTEARPEARRSSSLEALTLQQIEPFASMDPHNLAELIGSGGEVVFDANSDILSPTGKKSKDPDFYVILSGEVELIGPVGADEQMWTTIGRLGPGDYVGERALVYEQPYPYRVHATTPVRAFHLSRKAYERLTVKVPSLAGFFKDKVLRHGLVKYLREITLLSRVSDQRLAVLAQKIKLQTFPANDILVRHGELCRNLFVIASGRFRVDSQQRGSLTTLTHLTEGKYLGEQLAGDEEVFPYSVVSETGGEAYIISRADYLDLVREMPEGFSFGAAGVPASVVLERTPPFDTLPPELVAEAAGDLRVKEFRSGETIIYQDDTAGSAFYIIASGQVEVLVQSADGTERSVNKLKAGQCFGEGALLTNAPRNATVRAMEDCQLLALYRREFNTILEKNPQSLGGFFGNTLVSRLRPKHIERVEVFEQNGPDGVTYIIKNLDRDTYLNISEQGYFIWGLLDGDHTMNDLAAAYFQKYKSLAMGALFSTIGQLQQLGFLEVTMDELMQRVRSGHRLSAAQRVQYAVAKFLMYKKEFKGADTHFRAIYNSFGRIFYTKPLLALLALINIAGIAAFVRMLATGNQLSSTKVTVWAIPIFIGVELFAIVTHEIGHGMTMIHVGRKVLGAGVGLMYLSPMAYVNTTDAWLATTRQRMAVTAAGPIVTLTEGSLAALVLLFVHQPILRLALVELMFFCFFAFLFNLAPILPTDGYTVLMDWFMIPDLRQRALRYLFTGNLFRGFRKRPWSRETRIFTIFGVFVAAFMLVMGLNTALSVNRILGPFLRSHLLSPLALAVQLLIICLMLLMFVLSMLKEAGITSRKSA